MGYKVPTLVIHEYSEHVLNMIVYYMRGGIFFMNASYIFL